MSWSATKKAAEKSRGDTYLKLKDGDKKELALVGEPVPFYQIYGDKTEYPDWVEGASFRFKINVIDIQTMKAHIWSSGKTVFDRLEYLQDEMGGVEGKLLIVSRQGSGKEDTTYNVDIKRQLNESEKQAIAAVKTFSLVRHEGGVPF